MSKAALATTSHIQEDQATLNIFVNGLAAHLANSFATAHRVISSTPTQYSDSRAPAGTHIGDRELLITIDGTTYYIPCMLVVAPVPPS